MEGEKELIKRREKVKKEVREKIKKERREETGINKKYKAGKMVRGGMGNRKKSKR